MKKVMIVIVILLLLGGLGYYFMSSRGKAPKIAGSNVLTGGGQKAGIFSSIKDALSKSLSLKCVYKDEKGVETTSYIKNGAVRVMMAASADPEQPDNFIMKDKKIYMWSTAKKTGFVYEITPPTAVSPGPTSAESVSPAEDKSGNQESLLAQIEKYKDACKVDAVADTQFTVPDDVKFQDMSALQKNLMKAIPSPAGSGTGNADYQNYLKGLMQQNQGQ